MSSKRPANFSWIEEGKLAAFGCPSSVPSVRYLLEHGIYYLVTLSPETTPAVHSFSDINWIEIKIREFHPPSNYQIEKFIAIC
ncbi:Dual specificity protein phosphatase 23, partial [Stegodyphus mimosarum]